MGGKNKKRASPHLKVTPSFLYSLTDLSTSLPDFTPLALSLENNFHRAVRSFEQWLSADH